MLRGVIFDFDGVIADSERLHLTGFRHALEAHGLTVSEAEYFSRYVGFDDRDGFTAILSDKGRDADAGLLAGLMDDKARVFAELARERVHIFPGVRELLESLSEPRPGEPPLAIGIGSGALRSEIELILRLCGLTRFFATIVSAEDVRRGKPDPATYLQACEALGLATADLQPCQCLVIEDTVAGLEAAKRAGMATVGVANSYPASALDADLVLDSLEQLDRERCATLVERIVRKKS